MKIKSHYFHTVGSPQPFPRASVRFVPFDGFSLLDKFEWIMNESKTNFELYIMIAFRRLFSMPNHV